MTAKKTSAPPSSASKRSTSRSAAPSSTAKTAAKTPAKAPAKTPAKAPAKEPAKEPAKTTARAGRAAAAAPTPALPVREGERPWTAKEIAEVRALLASDEERLRVEISAAEEEIGQLLRQGGEGAGHDQADVGSNTFERDHEMSMARNARDNLVLVHEALARIDEGVYGVCESCGRAVGKMRLLAFPRATLCMECKQRQERR